MSNSLETNAPLHSDATDRNEELNNTEITQEPEKKEFNTRADVIARLQVVVDKAVEEVKDEVDYLKQLYYKIRKQEIETAKAEFLAVAENKAEDFEIEADLLEENLKQLLNTFKAKKQTLMEERERAKEENLVRKEAILDKMKDINDDADNIGKHYNEFQELKKQFVEITDIPQAKSNDIYKRFQICAETFYDMLKINKELRDYDFKKNFERKEAICQEAEALLRLDDVVIAFRKLQELHDEWKTIGPVAPQFREEIWNRFKSVSAIINKSHQQHFETIKDVEVKNEELKIALCEKAEAIVNSAITSLNEWDAKTKEIIELQNEWKTIGFAPRKINNSLYERFRTICDNFFKEKNLFYTGIKEEMNANLEKKRALTDKAESLKDSTDWRQTTDILIGLQKEWKSIGTVPRKYSDSLWKRFNEACDHFFAQREKALASTRQSESENMAKKKQIIARVHTLTEQENPDHAEVRSLMDEWNTVGHVPFREKERLYKEYQSALDVVFKKLNVKGRKAHLDNFADNVSKMSDANSAYRERDKLSRTYDRIKNEVATYENNMGFLTLKSKGGNSLVKEMERKIVKLKEDMAVIAQKIKMIDENMK